MAFSLYIQSKQKLNFKPSKKIGKNVDNYSSKYGKFILLGDLNSEPSESAVRDFCQIYGCKTLIKGSTCFKNPEKPSCIDLIIKKKIQPLSHTAAIKIFLMRYLWLMF